jgi:hypothetical protein
VFFQALENISENFPRLGNEQRRREAAKPRVEFGKKESRNGKFFLASSRLPCSKSADGSK